MDRMLGTNGTGRQIGFDIRPATGGMRITGGTVVGVNGKTAEETAIANLADLSERTDGRLALWVGGTLPTYFNGAHKIAEAEHGCVWMTE